ncbi:MAG: porphobilinogen synthase [Acidimicrobiia bacterium]
MTFPSERPRRLRRTKALRDLVRETDLSPRELVVPFFVKEGIADFEAVPTMPGVFQHTLASLEEAAKEAFSCGIRAAILFGIPESKDAVGSEASNPNGIVQRAVSRLKDAFGEELVVICDLCLDEYTEHGHCGVIKADGNIDNDATLERYREIAVSQAAAGADIVAPSGMMDGQVSAVREALDSAGYSDVAIMAYSSKFASTLYGPFRDAAECAPRFGDRSSYQLDPANAREAMRESLLDEEEGADILMVKPASFYLDIVASVKQATTLPVAAYQVSGEYASLVFAAERGCFDLPSAMLESLLCIKRAGADVILTYFAVDAARALG